MKYFFLSEYIPYSLNEHGTPQLTWYKACQLYEFILLQQIIISYIYGCQLLKGSKSQSCQQVIHGLIKNVNWQCLLCLCYQLITKSAPCQSCPIHQHSIPLDQAQQNATCQLLLIKPQIQILLNIILDFKQVTIVVLWTVLQTSLNARNCEKEAKDGCHLEMGGKYMIQNFITYVVQRKSR